MFNEFKIKFEKELSYTQFKEVSKFIHELSNSTFDFVIGPNFFSYKRGEEGIYIFKIENNKIIINLL